MFEVPEGVVGASWSITSHGRGHRVNEVKKGTYLIEHVATGRCIVGSSANVSKEVDGIVKQIKALKYPKKLFNSLFKLDQDIRIFEYPTKTLKLAKETEKHIRQTIYPKYLLLN